MIQTLLVAARDRSRLKEIVQIASRFGLDVLLARLGLDSTQGHSPGETSGQNLPQRTRQALEALGPTFMKLGQILATRGDLLPPEWIAELEQLHSQAPVLPFETLRPALEEALGEPPESIFASFDTVPLAAASMAQVHRATLSDGRPVVLKIRRPGIRPLMEADLRLIAQVAEIVEAASAEARRFAPAAMMRQLTEAVLEELDFTTEGRNADRLSADFARNSRVVIPEIHWLWTSESVLVMDYIDGMPPSNATALRSAGIDPAIIASLGADIMLDMVLINGRFHGDPHPGNLLCLPGNRMALLDLGMIGHVSPRRREEFITFVQSFNTGDPRQLADVLSIWSADSRVKQGTFHSVAERLIAKHSGGHLVLKALVGDFMAVMRDEGLVMPPDLLLIFKALVTVDGVLSSIVPDFNLSGAMQRSTLRIASSRLSIEHWGPIVQGVAWELSKFGDDMPRLLRAAMRRLEADPATLPPSRDHSAAIASAGRWIAGAIVASGALISAAMAFT